MARATPVSPAALPAVVSGLVQPNGAIVCLVSDANAFPNHSNKLVRLLATSAPDPTFNYVNTAGNLPDEFGATVVAQVPTTGGYVAGGLFSANNTSVRLMVGVTATGATLPGFAAPFQPIVTATVLESGINKSDGRILVGGRMQQNSQPNAIISLLARLEANGQLDASFNASSFSVPGAIRGYYEQPRVAAIVVQPDGAILVGGYFLQAGGQAVTGLVRLRAAGVLTVRTGASAKMEGWPVPAHDVLHLKLDAAALPKRVSLLDVVGKSVLTQPANQTEFTLNTAPIASGLYILRVDYASGLVTRQVVVE